MRILLALALCAVTAVAQTDVVSLPQGSTFAVRLKHTVKSSQAHAGDTVEATLLAPVVHSGAVIIPREAAVIGTVLYAEPLSKGRLSRLVIRFDEARFQRHTVALSGFIVRQLALKRTMTSRDRATCGTIYNPPPNRRSGAAGDGAGPIAPPRSVWATADRVDSGGIPCGMRSDKDKVATVTFVAPPLKDMVLQKLLQPAGGTEIVSSKRNVELSRGTLFEVRQVEAQVQLGATQP